MGTVASLRTSVPPPPGLLEAVEGVHAHVDATFSLHRPDSPASRVARGELTPEAAGPEIAAAFERSERWRAATGGAFTPYAADGTVDLTGIAKALAMEEAERLLLDAVPGWLLNVGGDVAWRPHGRLAGQVLAVADPADPRGLLCTVPLDAGQYAAATSGTAERGEHIRRTGGRAEFVQATVLAADVVTADVLATAVVAGGEPQLLDAAARPGVEVLAVTAAGELRCTDGFAAHLAA
jgi:thiamine biosynthesis lipoprotein